VLPLRLSLPAASYFRPLAALCRTQTTYNLARQSAHCKAVEKNGKHVTDLRPSKALRRLCIVVADDDRDAVLTLQMLLREEGHETHGVYTAQHALDAVLKFEPDVLILDIALGRSSGYDVAQKVRARHGDERPIIIGVSGIYKKSSDRILAEIKGFNHYLVKPYDPSELLGLLVPLRSVALRPVPEFKNVERDDTYRIAVARAASLLGGVRELRDQLHVPMSDLTQWLVGKSKPPINVFLRVIDIILAEQAKGRIEPPSAQIIELPKKPDPS
jgi:CheY-like chemotaxis protein